MFLTETPPKAMSLKKAIPEPKLKNGLMLLIFSARKLGSLEKEELYPVRGSI